MKEIFLYTHTSLKFIKITFVHCRKSIKINESLKKKNMSPAIILPLSTFRYIYFLTISFMCAYMYKIGVILHVYFAFLVLYAIDYIRDIFLIHNLQIFIILLSAFPLQTKAVLPYFVNANYRIFKTALASLEKPCLQ